MVRSPVLSGCVRRVLDNKPFTVLLLAFLIVSALDIVSSLGHLDMEVNPVIVFLDGVSPSFAVAGMVFIKVLMVSLWVLAYKFLRFRFFTYLLFLLSLCSIMLGHLVVVVNNFLVTSGVSALFSGYGSLALFVLALPFASVLLSWLVFVSSFRVAVN